LLRPTWRHLAERCIACARVRFRPRAVRARYVWIGGWPRLCARAAALGVAWNLAAVVIAVVAGIWICGESARRLGVHDHPAIVWDEVAGMMIAMLAAPDAWWGALLAFRAVPPVSTFANPGRSARSITEWGWGGHYARRRTGRPVCRAGATARRLRHVTIQNALAATHTQTDPVGPVAGAGAHRQVLRRARGRAGQYGHGIYLSHGPVLRARRSPSSSITRPAPTTPESRNARRMFSWARRT